jgi:predicted secreted protein
VTRSRVVAASGLAFAVVAAGAGVTWAATNSGHDAAAGPVTSVADADADASAGSGSGGGGAGTGSGSGTGSGGGGAGSGTGSGSGGGGGGAGTGSGSAARPAPVAPSPSGTHRTGAISPRVELFGPEKLPTTPVALKAGQKLVVHLREQAGSTGFSWSATSVPANLTLLKDDVVEGVGAPGAAGEHNFTFQAARSGDGKIEFVLRRPWAGGETAQRVGLGVTVGDARTVEVYGPEQLPRTPVAVRVGDTLAVHLTEQAGSTGMSWSVTNAVGMSPIGDTVVPGQGALGAAGEHVFTLRVDSTGPGVVTFLLNRPGGSGVADTVQVLARG